MAFYTYIRPVDPAERTSRIILRGGELILGIGQYADLSDAEVAFLSPRYVLQAGTSGTPAPEPVPGLHSILNELAVEQLIEETKEALADKIVFYDKDAIQPRDELSWDAITKSFFLRDPYFLDPAHPSIGAKLDGVTDDSNAIQKALDLSSTLGIPVRWNGRALVSKTLILRYRSNIDGLLNGAYEEGVSGKTGGPAQASVLVLQDGSNCTVIRNEHPDFGDTNLTVPLRAGQDGAHYWQRSQIRNLVIVGNRFKQTVGGRNGGHGIHLHKCWGVQLDAVAIYQIAGHGIFRDDVNEVHVGGKTVVVGSGGNAIYDHSAADCTVDEGAQFGGCHDAVVRMEDAFGNQWDNVIAFNSNFAWGVLDAPLSAGATTLTFYRQNPVGIPTWGCKFKIDNEYIDIPASTTAQSSTTVTLSGQSVTKTTITGVTRGANDFAGNPTVAATHAAGARVQEMSPDPHGVVVRNSIAIHMSGRTDQNFGSGLYVIGNTFACELDVEVHTSGWENPTPQPAVYNDGKGVEIEGPIAVSGPFWGLLENPITAADTTVSVIRHSTSITPDAQSGVLRIGDELVHHSSYITSSAGSLTRYTFALDERGYKGTVAASHAASDRADAYTSNFACEDEAVRWGTNPVFCRVLPPIDHRWPVTVKPTMYFEGTDSLTGNYPGKTTNFVTRRNNTFINRSDYGEEFWAAAGMRIGWQADGTVGILFDQSGAVRLKYVLVSGRPIIRVDNADLELTQTGRGIKLPADGFITLTERSTDPAAPSADQSTIYAKDDGTGNTVVAARASDGRIQVLAERDWTAPSAGDETVRRETASNTSMALATGQMRVAYFLAQRTEAITKLLISSGGTAAGATPTLVRAGIYSVNTSDWSLTALLAAIANDTSLFAATNTEYLRSLTSTFNKQAGTVYAFGLLVVSGATMPSTVGATLGNAGVAAGGNGRPRLTAIVNSQTDLPASVAAVNLANTSVKPYALLAP